MTATTSRSLFGIVFAALLALSLVATTQDAIAKTTGTNPLPALFDEGFDDQGTHHGRPIGRLGISWE
jgi:hypothetical protein